MAVEQPIQEVDFRAEIARMLSSPEYGHKVYFHESPNEFSVHGAPGFVDLYVETNPLWPHHKKFPVIGVETKLARSMGWLIDAVEQVDKYDRQKAKATYTIDSAKVLPPTLFLVVTPDSWKDGFVYEWLPPEYQATSSNTQVMAYSMQWGGWFALIILYERLLMRHGAALLRKGQFYTNMFGRKGAVTKYDLRLRG